MNVDKKILPLIVVSQFMCTSLWFAGNAITPELVLRFGLATNAMGALTSAVQLGFIAGTLIFALFSIADRYSPSLVFATCAVVGAITNLGMLWSGNTLATLFCFRLLTGFFLAGIYPVGMKIAADYYDQGLGKSLGYLVGALVLGTAFPHVLKAIGGRWSWQFVVLATSGFAVTGGGLIGALVPDGPHRSASQKIDFTAIGALFRQRNFRAAAFGYFGHMWELYAFWAFVPAILSRYAAQHPANAYQGAVWSFGVIAVGGVACIISGYLAQRFTAKRVAFTALLLSFLCCVCFYWIFSVLSPALFLLFMFFWGMVVVADSPLFSTLVAQNAPPQLKGTALTIVNAIGFSVTILSIQLISFLQTYTQASYLFSLLMIGPLLGLIAMRRG